jgi:hypothetical protein
MRGDARGLAQDGDVDVADAAARLFHKSADMLDEQGGGRTAPLGIARREMIAYIAGGDRSEQGVCECVQHDVGIAVPDQGGRMRDSHAPEPDRIARAEAVDVEPAADTRRPARLKQCLRPAKVLVISELLECRVARHKGDLDARGARDLRIVGRFAACPGRMRAQDAFEVERLRGLDALKIVSWYVVAKRGSAAGKRIDDRKDRHCALRAV